MAEDVLQTVDESHRGHVVKGLAKSRVIRDRPAKQTDGGFLDDGAGCMKGFEEMGRRGPAGTVCAFGVGQKVALNEVG